MVLLIINDIKVSSTQPMKLLFTGSGRILKPIIHKWGSTFTVKFILVTPTGGERQLHGMLQYLQQELTEEYALLPGMSCVSITGQNGT